MIILASVRRFMRICGLWFEDGQSFAYRLYRVFCIIVLLMLVQPQYAFFCAHLDDMIAASDVSIQLVSELMAVGKVFGLVYHHRMIGELLAKFQLEFDASERRGRSQHYLAAEKETSSVSHFYGWMLLLAGVAHCGGPLVVVAIAYVKGTLEPEMWTHPFNGVYVFDPNTSPGYEFAYVLGIMYNTVVAMSYGANDMLYLGLCRYAAAFLDSFVDSYAAMDREYALEMDQKLVCGRTMKRAIGDGKKAERILCGKMRENIRTHYRILELLEKIARTQSVVIFCQFAGVIVVLSTLAYQAQISDDRAAIIMYGTPAACILAELFIYCFYGNLLFYKSLECADKLWLNSGWYAYPVHLQKHFQLTLMQLQTPIILSGFGFVECTLDTFVAALKMVGSVITLLQSMEDV